jgi:hypothetical protein
LSHCTRLPCKLYYAPLLNYYGVPLPTIYSADYVENLISIIKRILEHSTHESPYFNFIIDVVLHAGVYRTVGRGFIVDKNTDLTILAHTLAGYIENFETQSGTPEERQEEEVVASLLRVMDRSNAPAVNWEDPLALPHSTNTTPLRTSQKRTRKNTEEKLAVIHSQINSLSSDIKTMTSELVNAIKSTPTSTQPTLLSGVNWAPIINGLANVLITNLGGQPVPSSTSPIATKPATQTPGEVQKVSPDLTPIIERMNTLETKLTSLSSRRSSLRRPF